MEPLCFYQNVSPSKELRDASTEAEQLARDYDVEVSMRVDLFQAKQAAKKNIEKAGTKLSPEEQRLVDKMIQDGTRAGLALPEKEREELMKLKKEVSAASLEFSVSTCLCLGGGVCVEAACRKTSMRKRARSLSPKRNSRASPQMSFPDTPNARRTARSCTMSHSRLPISSLWYVQHPMSRESNSERATASSNSQKTPRPASVPSRRTSPASQSTSPSSTRSSTCAARSRTCCSTPPGRTTSRR